MIELSDIILIGEFVRTHGKAGELQCRTLNEYWDESEAEFIMVMLDAIPVPFRVLEWRGKGADILFTLKGIATEEQALRLVGSEVYMRREDVKQVNEYNILSWQDLVGYTIDGSPIVEIDDSTVNVLATLADGRLIPLHEDLITALDPNHHTLTMNLPQGL